MAQIIPQGLTIVKNGNSYNIEFELPDLNFDTIIVTKHDGTIETFFDIKNNDDFGIIDSIGLPQIPQLTFSFAIPYNSNKPNFSINNIQTEELILSNKIYPFQQPWTTDKELSEREFYINQDYYASAGINFNPVVISEPYIIAGTKGMDIRINPIVYNPSQDKLLLRKKISFTINFNQPITTKSVGSIVLDNFFNDVFVNYPINNKSVSYGNYLIITAPEYQEMINRFANYKANIGYTVTVVNTNTTGTTKEQIKDYIQSQYDNISTRPVFVLLVGDVDKIPNWIGSHSDHPPTDLNYSLLEGSDDEADVFLGRFSVSDNQDLENIINKTIYMETNVQNWNKKVVFAAGFDCYGYFRAAHNSVESIFENKGYNCQKIYQDKDQTCRFGWVPVSEENVGTTTDLHNAINNNITFLIYSGHGYETGIYNPAISNSDVSNGLFSNSLYPFTFSFACLSNNFAYSYGRCFGEAWLRDDNCGVTYYGASIPTFYGTDKKLEKKIFNKGFGNANKEQIGPMVVYGMKKVLSSIASASRKKRYVQMYNLLGDPSINTSGIDASCLENYVFYNSVSYGNGENLTFKANNSIITAEGNSTFTVTGNANIKLIAGNSIELNPGTHIVHGPGGYFEASIAPCNSSKSSEVNLNNSSGTLDNNEKINKDTQKLNDFEIIAYPNPFTEQCYIEYSLQSETNVNVEVYNLLGKKVFSKKLNNQAIGKNTIILTNKELQQKGIYIIKIQTDNQTRTLFILKQ